MKVKFLSLALILLLPLNATATTDMEAALKDAISDPDHEVAPGCAYGIFAGANETFVANGFADLETRKPIDEDTVFYAASLSKQFTVIALAQLVQAGRIGLDDDARDYLPELPTYSTPVTVDMLVHHTAGIRDSLTLLRLAGLSATAADAKEQAMRLLFQQQGTTSTPGTRFAYSNGGYLLLAGIVERLTGQSFASYARQNILEPLGMDASYFLDGEDRPSPHRAHGYIKEAGGFQVRDTYPRFSGSGGLMTTMRDLARYERDIARGHRVWTPKVREIMLAPGKLTNGGTVRHPTIGLPYAGGLLVGQRNGRHVVQHGGGAEGFKHSYVRLPDDGLSIITLCNRGDWVAQERLEAAIDIVRPGLLQRLSVDSLQGSYHSAELSTVYHLQAEGDDLLVTIRPSLAPAAPASLLFSGSPQDGFKNGSISLKPDPDGNGFMLASGRVSGLHFTSTEP